MNRYSLFVCCTLTFLLSSCYGPPYHQFEPEKDTTSIAAHTAAGTGIGAAIGVAAGATLVGAGVGLGAGGVAGLIKNSRPYLIRKLAEENIQTIDYLGTTTLIIPTDIYFVSKSARLDDLKHVGLENVIRLIQASPHHTIYVAGFSDHIGSAQQRYMRSDAYANAIITFLWANGIPAKHLSLQGYGDTFTIADPQTIHGDAQNRHVEIQWHVKPNPAVYNTHTMENQEK
ncbi:MAG: OmpA family protein [Legionellaceae bacterium]|nr:OmpA family protein [Legionellaceae bacterium]